MASKTTGPPYHNKQVLRYHTVQEDHNTFPLSSCEKMSAMTLMAYYLGKLMPRCRDLPQIFSVRDGNFRNLVQGEAYIDMVTYQLALLPTIKARSRTTWTPVIAGLCLGRVSSRGGPRYEAAMV